MRRTTSLLLQVKGLFSFHSNPLSARRACDGKHFISARELSASLRFFFAEFLETRILAERVPDRTDPKVAGSFAIRHFEKMRQSGDGGIDIAKLRLDDQPEYFRRKVWAKHPWRSQRWPVAPAPAPCPFRQDRHTPRRGSTAAVAHRPGTTASCVGFHRRDLRAQKVSRASSVCPASFWQ